MNSFSHNKSPFHKIKVLFAKRSPLREKESFTHFRVTEKWIQFFLGRRSQQVIGLLDVVKSVTVDATPGVPQEQFLDQLCFSASSTTYQHQFRPCSVL